MSDEFFVVSASAKDKDAAEISPKVSAAMCTAAFKTLSDGNSSNLEYAHNNSPPPPTTPGCNSSPDARTCERYALLLSSTKISVELRMALTNLAGNAIVANALLESSSMPLVLRKRETNFENAVVFVVSPKFVSFVKHRDSKNVSMIRISAENAENFRTSVSQIVVLSFTLEREAARCSSALYKST